MLNSENCYTKLKEVIVGREFELSDSLFKLFKEVFKENLDTQLYYNPKVKVDEYPEIFHERSLQLGELTSA